MANVVQVEDYDAVGLAGLVAAGQVSPAELTEAAITRIERHDRQINAVVHRMFDAAREQVARGLPEGPLRGVPYLIKDLHARVAGEPTSDGSELTRGLREDRDSTLVARLRAAGVVLLGKTNTPELGIMGITEPRRHGPTRNPWSLDHTPGGSSGGSAAAVAARMVPAAHASDGGGSIRIPASHCGLVGLKPSRGRTPAGPDRGWGWGGLAVEHAVTRTVRDTAALLDVVAGHEPGAGLQVDPIDGTFSGQVDIEPGPLRIGFSATALLAGQADPACVAAVERAAEHAEGLGHHVERVELPLHIEEVRRAYFTCVACGVAADVRALADRRGRPARPSDVEPTTWVFKQIGEALRGVDVERARRVMHTLGFDLARFFTRFDVWLTPTCAQPPARVGALYPDAAKERLMLALRFVGTRGVLLSALDRLAAEAISATPNTQIANLAGLPAISLPLHQSDEGLPIGTQWIAPFGRESRLLQLAGQLERAHPWASLRPKLVESP